jgi:hypothetical protein
MIADHNSQPRTIFGWHSRVQNRWGELGRVLGCLTHATTAIADRLDWLRYGQAKRFAESAVGVIKKDALHCLTMDGTKAYENIRPWRTTRAVDGTVAS